MTPKQCREHYSKVAALPCMATGSSPVILHHPHSGSMRERGIHKGMAQKVSNYLVIPLTDACHKELHQNITVWEAKYGAQAEMVDELCRILGMDLWALAKEDCPSKILPRQ